MVVTLIFYDHRKTSQIVDFYLDDVKGKGDADVEEYANFDHFEYVVKSNYQIEMMDQALQYFCCPH